MPGKQMTQTQLLIVLPETGTTPTDDYLEELAYQLLDAKKPTVIDLFKHAFWTGGTASIGGFALREPTWARPDKQVEMGLALYLQKDLIIKLLRALHRRDVTSILPGAMVVKSSDPRLNQWTTLGNSFLSANVYASHPCDNSFFIPLAGFHDYLLDDKRAEFVKLSSALGAASIKLVSTEDASENTSASAGTTEPTGHVDVGVDANSKAHTFTRFNLSVSFERPRRQPRLHEALRWLSREPLWRAMADARLLDGASTFQVKFQYDEDFAVNAKLAATVRGLGLSAGETFRTMQRVSQTYEVSFHPQSAYGKTTRSSQV